MPWDASGADKHKKGLTPAQKSKWAKIANGVLKSCKAKGGKDCEGKAIRIANSKMSRVDINSTWILADMDDHDEFFGFKDQPKSVTEARKKKGGSNVGTYKKGPFCGPAGGAPKGSYPVNTRKRARAAIAYARHAPNPQGIKNCVYRHWPDLKPKKKNKQSEEDTVLSNDYEVPKGALRFVEEGTAHCEFADIDGKKVPKLAMMAYTGKVIKNHFWWGNLVIDLDGMSFEGNKFPILENHMVDKKIAFTSKPIITDDYQLKIDSDKTTFVDTEASAEFQKLSAEGFPYQASIYAKPLQIQRLMENETVDVNGFTFKGPGTIWRKCKFREASVCVFGWDTKTSSTAFSRTEMEEIDCEDEFQFSEENAFNNNNNDVKGGDIVDLEQFKSEYPEIAEQFKSEIVDEVTINLTEKFDDEKKKLSEEKDGLSEKVKNQEDKIANLEKNDAIRTANELAARANTIFSNCLAESDVVEDLHDKVKAMVRHTKFVKDGVLDEEKFTETVKAEIKDWEDKGATSKVIGTGFAKKNETGENTEQTQLTEQNKSMVNNLLARAGQPPKTE